ncbi:methyltransferase [Sporichthya brevicatena]|uniref:Methyltransferase n=1 Tax=Sporichthya brevicatena TaxID=171442 RepID=A0ABP3RWB8_9ACTN
MADLTRARSSVRTAVVWEALRPALDDLLADPRGGGRTELEVLDVGGGTGGFAVPLAQSGHRVTVLDPSPDALASLGRRVAEAGVAAQVRAVQGDADNLAAVAAPGSFDLLLCHGALEHTDDPAASLAAALATLRPGGALSLLAANRNAAVFARAISGHVVGARHALEDPTGRWGASDPLPRRFAPDDLVAMLEAAGARVLAIHGVRVFSDLVPSGVVEGEAAAREDLVALESAVAELPAFRAIATQLHVLAVRP